MTATLAISGAQMARIDTVMADVFGVNTFQLMELAGFAIAEAVRRRPSPSPRILALAGTGGNGGDAMVAARLLAGRGHICTVILAKPRADYTGIAAHQVQILERMAIAVVEPDAIATLPPSDLILDGLLGFSLRTDPHGDIARLIRLANADPAPTLAIDLPSGLRADTGAIGNPCICADQTVTLALAKTGLLAAPASLTGAIWLADIGVPPQAYAQIGVTVPPDLFASDSLVRIR